MQAFGNADAEKRNSVEYFLNPPEGAEPAAEPPAKRHAEEGEQSDDVEGEVETARIGDGLQRADGAGTQRAGTGVAVQNGNADSLQIAGVDGAPDKALKVAVDDECTQSLDEMPATAQT